MNVSGRLKKILDTMALYEDGELKTAHFSFWDGKVGNLWEWNTVHVFAVIRKPKTTREKLMVLNLHVVIEDGVSLYVDINDYLRRDGEFYKKYGVLFER